MQSLVRALLGLVATILVAGSSSAQDRRCLDELRQEGGQDSDYAFDLRVDHTKKNDSFSCDLAMRASAAAAAIEMFRFGVLYDSERHINESVRFPLSASVQKTREVTEGPKSVTIRTFAEWDVFKKSNFTKLKIAQIACASLHTVEIVKSRSYGFMIGSGMVWFQALTNVPGVRVTAVNLVPVERDIILESCTQELIPNREK
jgi:hypothetical protein